jgi:hypothetical protein
MWLIIHVVEELVKYEPGGAFCESFVIHLNKGAVDELLEVVQAYHVVVHVPPYLHRMHFRLYVYMWLYIVLQPVIV